MSVVCGPSGGMGGLSFVDDALPSATKVIEVLVRAGARIDAVQIIYEAANGARHPLPWHGGNGGALQEPFLLDKNEYIYKISGRYGGKVDSITIHTANFGDQGREYNRRTYGGGGGIAEFVYTAPPGWQIIGLCGRSGAEIDALGVTFASIAL